MEPRGLSRRLGPAAWRPILGAARDAGVLALRRLLRAAAGERLRSLHWASTLVPDGLGAARSRVPLGDVIGMAAVLAPADHGGRP